MTTNVSVLICTRDRPDTVGQAIESVASAATRASTCTSWTRARPTRHSVIVESLAERFAGKVPIRYHHLDKAGLSRAYNAGFRVSRRARSSPAPTTM